jgi:hypothetical protein
MQGAAPDGLRRPASAAGTRRRPGARLVERPHRPNQTGRMGEPNGTGRIAHEPNPAESAAQTASPGGERHKREWRLALLPAATVRSWNAKPVRARRLPWSGFRPRPCGPGRFPFGFPSKPKLLGSARVAHEANFKGPFGSPSGEPAGSPEETSGEPEKSSFGQPTERTPTTFLSRVLRPKSPETLDTSGKWGRLGLAPLPHASSSRCPASRFPHWLSLRRTAAWAVTTSG